MKDTIIANTGNSRYLKSGIDADTTWAEFLQMLIAGTLPIDLNGLNAAGITQQGTLLNTANLLSAAACAALGLSQATAVPSDALVAIGNALTGHTNAISANEKALCRTNLLDNWYFPNAVNQRGETSWDSSYIGYTVDRWDKVDTGFSLSLQSDGIAVSYGGTSSQRFWYNISKSIFDSIKGKRITVSVLCKDVNKSSNSDIELYCSYLHTYTRWLNLSEGINTISFDVTYDDYPQYKPHIVIQGRNGASACIVAIKLEVGENQTLAREVNGSWILNDVPDYGEQLMRCKRFYQVLNFTGCVGYAQTASGVKKAMIGVPLPVDMDESIQTATITSYRVGSVMTSSGTTQPTEVTKPDTKLSGVENTPTDGCFAILVSVSTTSILNGYPVVATGVSVTLSTEE